MKRLKVPVLCGAVTVLLLATSAVSAQGIGVSFGKHGKNRHVNIGIGIPIGGGHHGHVHTSSCQRYVPGHYEMVREQAWVPGVARHVWVHPTYRTEYDHCGRAYQVQVTNGYYETVSDPGRYEWVERKVWVHEQWSRTCGY